MIKILRCSARFVLFLAVYMASLSATEKAKKNSEENTTTGFMQEITEQRVYSGPPRSGKDIYQYRCGGCHGKNTQGAPMPDDKYDWGVRLQKGIATLYKHSLEGYSSSLMPPKGGCRNCSDDEVLSAVRYMIETSGNVVPTITKKN